MTIYAILVWFGVGLVCGFVLGVLAIACLIAKMIKDGEAYIKYPKGDWIPNDPTRG